MKKPGFLAASVVAASASAVSASSSSSSSSSSSTFTCKSNFQLSRQENVTNSKDQEQGPSSSASSASGNQFEPRFDGLRFIETLVTAHR